MDPDAASGLLRLRGWLQPDQRCQLESPAYWLVGDIHQVPSMSAWDHQRMPRGRGIDVHERDGVIVGSDDLSRHIPGDYGAEQAVLGHGGAA